VEGPVYGVDENFKLIFDHQRKWKWVQNEYREGKPPDFPSWLNWSREQWQAWMNRHLDPALVESDEEPGFIVVPPV
jgi:hypothetical protein